MQSYLFIMHMFTLFSKCVYILFIYCVCVWVSYAPYAPLPLLQKEVT